MELTVLGRHGPYPPGGGACSSYLVTCEGREFLLDMGPGSLSRLMERGMDKLEALVLTHLHWDHISDALPLGYALARRGRKVRVFLPKEPRELSGLFEDSPYLLTYVEGGQAERLWGLRLRFYQMRHAVPGFGVRVEGEGKCIAYTGDTNTCGNLAPLLKDADLALADAALSDAQWDQGQFHLSARHAAQAMRKARVRRPLLTHLPPDGDDAINILLSQAREDFPRAEPARELTTYHLDE